MNHEPPPPRVPLIVIAGIVAFGAAATLIASLPVIVKVLVAHFVGA